MIISDAHVHFFSHEFFQTLAKQSEFGKADDPVAGAIQKLGWDPPGAPVALATRWISELDRNGVDRCGLIASVPGDEGSVALAVRRYPARFVGYFMANPLAAGAAAQVEKAIQELDLRVICLFPAMHRFRLDGPEALELIEVVAGKPGCALFVHCGVLSVGVRRKLGLPSPFDIRLGNPLDLQEAAISFPELPIIIPHFGAGFLREALMLASLHSQVFFDTSSSNSWVRFTRGLTLEGVFDQCIDLLGPDRLLFGSDSSFFPRGWNREVFEKQQHALVNLGVDGESQKKIFRRNFDRLFP